MSDPKLPKNRVQLDQESFTRDANDLIARRVTDEINSSKLDQVISVLQEIDLNTDEIEIKIDNVDLNTDELETKLDTVNSNLTSIQNTLQTEFDATQLLLQTEFDATQTLLENEFDETQTKQDEQTSELQDINTELDDFRLDYNTQTDETQNILQTEFDATQTLLQTELDQTQAILQTEFDQSQAQIDTITTKTNTTSLKVGISDRPSELRNRVRVFIPYTRTTLSGTPTVLYTVTPGFRLYISSFLVSVLNSSNADAEIRIRDNTNQVIPLLAPARVSGSSPSSFSLNAPTLPEPLLFLTNVNVLQITGTTDIAGYFIGYEEPI